MATTSALNLLSDDRADDSETGLGEDFDVVVI